MRQKRELTFLSWNHFVPASDEELRKQAEAFSKANNCTVRIDTIAHLQLPAKYAAEAQSQSGHDMILTREADPFLYENQLADVGDIIDDIGKKYGGWYPFSAELAQTKSGWRVGAVVLDLVPGHVQPGALQEGRARSARRRGPIS